MSVETIFTPGHIDDHVSFSLTEDDSTEKVLICGDIILGVPSASIQNFSHYMKSLAILKEMNFDWILLPHTTDFEPESVMVKAKQKIEDYIEYRHVRLL